MAKTMYRVYEIDPRTLDDSIEHSLHWLGETEATSARQAVSLIVTEPRENTEYAAIPAHNINVCQPKFKPSMWTWK